MLRRSLTLVVAALALTLCVPLTAQADTLKLIDARGDVHRITEPGRYRHVPGEHRADITRTTIRHSNRAVIVRTKLVRLRRERGAQVSMQMRMRSNDGTYRLMTLNASHTLGWRGEVNLLRRNQNLVDCQTAHRIDYANDLIAVRIPRSCISDPRWVQATVASLVLGRRLLVDNPHNDKGRLNTWSARIRRG